MAIVERVESSQEAAVPPAGDACAALERLYVEHSGRVLATCASILRDRYEAEDAAQQVFVSALRALRAGTVPREPGAWLATIARRECWARARRRAAAPLPGLALDPVGQDDPATIAVRRAELVETWRTIAALPAAQRNVLLLRAVRGLGYDELADDLQLSHASVRSLLTRARRTVRTRLERGAAVISGAPWLNVLVRLVSDGTGSGASSATRAAAVGLGALALTGGVVVAPTLTARPHAVDRVGVDRVVAEASGLRAPGRTAPGQTASARAAAPRSRDRPASAARASGEHVAHRERQGDVERGRGDGDERAGGNLEAHPTGGDSHDGPGGFSGGSGSGDAAGLRITSGDSSGSGGSGSPGSGSVAAVGSSDGGSGSGDAVTTATTSGGDGGAGSPDGAVSGGSSGPGGLSGSGASSGSGGSGSGSSDGSS